jgi:hypothetical protein
MTTTSLPDVTTFINQQLLDHEQVSGCLAKAEAMAYIAMTDSFAEQVEEHQRNYLWALRDLLTEAEQLHGELLSKWYKYEREFKE